jgi:putative nucleotidyltransferase with HDIG domain
MKTSKENKRTMDCLYSTLPNDGEPPWVASDGETLPDKASKRSEPGSAYLGLPATLILTLKIKDAQLYIHSRRVQQFTHLLMLASNLPKERAAAIELAALFHDIGKIVLPGALLQKATCLTQEEFETSKKHPLYSALILNKLGMPDNVVKVVYHHHECWDGRGYPGGLRGEAIPLGARLIAIADAFEAMTAHRIYQTRHTPMQALEELRRCAGSQFDPVLVERFYTKLQTVLLDGSLYSEDKEMAKVVDHDLVIATTPVKVPTNTYPPDRVGVAKREV